MSSASRWVQPRQLVYAAVLPCLFVGGAVMGRVYVVDVTVERASVRAESVDQYRPNFALEPGDQLVMVYIGSSTCAWSNQPDLPEAVERIKLELAAHASALGMSFKAVGLAIDWSPALGIEHLRKFGAFDEVSSGYNWGSTLAMRYLWSNPEALGSTPQIQVYARRVITPDEGSGVLFYGEDGRRPLATRRGSQEIVEWAEAGVARETSWLPSPEPLVAR